MERGKVRFGDLGQDTARLSGLAAEKWQQTKALCLCRGKAIATGAQKELEADMQLIFPPAARAERVSGPSIAQIWCCS